MPRYGFSVFLGNLSDRCRSEDIEDLFRKYHVSNIDLKRGFGFVEFDDKRDAEDAIRDCNGERVRGERISLELSKGCRDKYKDFNRTGRVRYRSYSRSASRSPPRRGGRDRGGGGGGYGGSRRSPPRRREQGRGQKPHRTKYAIEVDNLSTRFSWADLKDLFRKCGEVTYTDAHYRMGEGRGEVCFETRDGMEKAMKDLNGEEINGKRIKLQYGDDSGRDRNEYRGGSRSRSRSYRRSRSRSRSRGRRDSRSRSDSRKRSRSNRKSGDKRSRSRSHSRKRDRSRSGDKSKSRSRSRSRGRNSKSRSRSRSRSNSR